MGARDAVQPRLDRRVAHPEGLLHLLDGTVGSEKGDDEDLVLQAKSRQLGKGERAFDGDLLLGDVDALDDQRAALRDA